MKKNEKPKVFNQKINLDHLEKISDIISKNYGAFAHAYSYKTGKDNKKHKFEYYNLLCTCILRIRETANYLSQFHFKQDNECGQAFDFYEFINCLSIIFGCTESLLNLFDIKLKDCVGDKTYFIKSNDFIFWSHL